MEAIRSRSGKLLLLAGALALSGVLVVSSATPVTADIDRGDHYTLVSPVLSIDDVTKAEGDAGVTVFTFTVSMSKPAGDDVRVNVQTSDGTATIANNDYTAVSTTLVIPARFTSGTIDVFVTGDIITEPDQTFFVDLVSVKTGNATIADGTGIGTILNDDKVSPCLRFNSKVVQHAEGHVGKTAYVFQVGLNNPIDQEVTVDFTTEDQTATVADNDYQPTSGTLTFPAKSTDKQIITVMVNGDVTAEADEVFIVRLTSSTLTICDDNAVGIILNDDGSTPALVSRFDAETLEDGIALHWQFGDASLVEASWVERSEGATGAWTRIEAEAVVENEVITVIDRSVEIGLEYRYRLVVKLADGQTVELDEITVLADLVKEFALSRVSPNPATGPARIDFAIPRAANVQLSIMDIQGRVVAVLVDGQMKAGRHQAVWNGESRTGRAYPGVYFVRYLTPERAFTKRLILTR